MMAKAAKAKTKTPSNRLPELLGLPELRLGLRAKGLIEGPLFRAPDLREDCKWFNFEHEGSFDVACCKKNFGGAFTAISTDERVSFIMLDKPSRSHNC